LASEYLVEVIIPSNEIHLLAGPSGAGKTRWLLHTLLEWEQGLDVLGFHSHPVPWVYVAADRSVISVQRTLLGMGIQPGLILAIPAWDKQMGVSEILDRIQASGAKLVVWESFGSFVEPPGNGKMVKQFLSRVGRFCRDHGVTIIAVVESPKQKPYERYENPRQRVSGAAAWGHFTETIFLVEPDEVDRVESPNRTLYVCPRNAPGMKIALAFDLQGRLLPYYEEPAAMVAANHRKRPKSTASD
jgi:RecA-family ATPase